MAVRSIRIAACYGMTLPELLIGLSIGLFISVGLLAMWLTLQESTLKALELARLNHDLQAISDLMADDIRRAGYRAWSPDSGLDISINPFMSAPYAITLDHAGAAEAEDSCLTYGYDLNQDGQAGGSVNEAFGFRLHDQAIEMRVGGAVFNCQQGSWQDITQSDTVIDTLIFTLDPVPLYPAAGCVAAQPCITRRLVTIQMSGHLSAQPAHIVSIQQAVRIANDRIS